MLLMVGGMLACVGLLVVLLGFAAHIDERATQDCLFLQGRSPAFYPKVFMALGGVVALAGLGSIVVYVIGRILG